MFPSFLCFVSQEALFILKDHCMYQYFVLNFRYIQEKLEISRFDPVYGQFLKILEAFKLEEPEQKKEEDEKAAAERKAEEERRRAEELRKVPKNLEEEPEEDVGSTKSKAVI